MQRQGEWRRERNTVIYLLYSGKMSIINVYIPFQHAIRISLPVLFSTVLLGGCQAPTQPVAAPAPVASLVVAAPSAVAEPSALAIEPSPSPTADPILTFVMPLLVGKDLQTAQDVIQTFGVFFSKSHDLAGTRMQVLDSNWKVCNQIPRAGATVKGTDKELEATIDFGVVKRTESCP